MLIRYFFYTNGQQTNYLTVSPVHASRLCKTGKEDQLSKWSNPDTILYKQRLDNLHINGCREFSNTN